MGCCGSRCPGRCCKPKVSHESTRLLPPRGHSRTLTFDRAPSDGGDDSVPVVRTSGVAPRRNSAEVLEAERRATTLCNDAVLEGQPQLTITVLKAAGARFGAHWRTDEPQELPVLTCVEYGSTAERHGLSLLRNWIVIAVNGMAVDSLGQLCRQIDSASCTSLTFLPPSDTEIVVKLPPVRLVPPPPAAAPSVKMAAGPRRAAPPRVGVAESRSAVQALPAVQESVVAEAEAVPQFSASSSLSPRLCATSPLALPPASPPGADETALLLGDRVIVHGRRGRVVDLTPSGVPEVVFCDTAQREWVFPGMSSAASTGRSTLHESSCASECWRPAFLADKAPAQHRSPRPTAGRGRPAQVPPLALTGLRRFPKNLRPAAGTVASPTAVSARIRRERKLWRCTGPVFSLEQSHDGSRWHVRQVDGWDQLSGMSSPQQQQRAASEEALMRQCSASSISLDTDDEISWSECVSPRAGAGSPFAGKCLASPVMSDRRMPAVGENPLPPRGGLSSTYNRTAPPDEPLLTPSAVSCHHLPSSP